MPLTCINSHLTALAYDFISHSNEYELRLNPYTHTQRINEHDDFNYIERITINIKSDSVAATIYLFFRNKPFDIVDLFIYSILFYKHTMSNRLSSYYGLRCLSLFFFD